MAAGRADSRHFVAATTINDTVPRYLATGRYEPRPSVPTLANAMDVGNPEQRRAHALVVRRRRGSHAGEGDRFGAYGRGRQAGNSRVWTSYGYIC